MSFPEISSRGRPFDPIFKTARFFLTLKLQAAEEAAPVVITASGTRLLPMTVEKRKTCFEMLNKGTN